MGGEHTNNKGYSNRIILFLESIKYFRNQVELKSSKKLTILYESTNKN